MVIRFFRFSFVIHIFFRISQGDKLARQIADMQKDHNDALTLIQDTLGDHKRKNLQSIEEVDFNYHSSYKSALGKGLRFWCAFQWLFK